MNPMPASDQGVRAPRYQVVPRTLIFLTHAGKVLLIKGAPTKRLWAGLYNGIGGHVERGEDVYSAAQRELVEETGLDCPSLRLCGTVMVDVEPGVGVCIFIFRGELPGKVGPADELRESLEGKLEWILFSQAAQLPLVEDLYILLPRLLALRPGDPPFSARSTYDEHGRLSLVFSQG